MRLRLIVKGLLGTITLTLVVQSNWIRHFLIFTKLWILFMFRSPLTWPHIRYVCGLIWHLFLSIKAVRALHHQILWLSLLMVILLLFHLFSAFCYVITQVIGVDFVCREVFFLRDVAQLIKCRLLLVFLIFSKLLGLCFLNKLSTLSLVNIEFPFRNISFIWCFSHFNIIKILLKSLLNMLCTK